MDNIDTIGIDLGTSNSSVAIFINNHAEIIENNLNSRLIPSYVLFNDNRVIVGEPALNQNEKNCKNTIFGIKRLIGCNFNDDNIQSYIKRLPYTVIDNNNKPCVQIEFENQTKRYTPEEISSIILSEIKKTAEAKLKHTVSNAVITVPAYFNNAQCEATRRAADMAGLNVLQIINEPSAAALAYGFNNKIKNKENILVIDLGGGTYDVSLVSIKKGKYNVIAISGDSHFGGEDFTYCLVDYFIDEIQNKHNINIYTHPNSKEILSRLRNACERAKQNLSINDYAIIEIVNLFDNISFSSSITRKKFEELCSDLIDKLITPINNVIKDSGLDKSKISDIVLVGGSTRIPKVQETIASHLNKDIKKSINVNEAVAYGAAIQTFNLKGKTAKTRDFLVKNFVPLSLDTSNGNKMDIIIEKDSEIPVKNTKTYYTTKDNQTSLLIDIYEGDYEKIGDNKLLGKFYLNKITPAPRGTIKIDITFEVNNNGILKVLAKENGSEKYNAIIIKNSRARLNQEIIDRTCNIM